MGETLSNIGVSEQQPETNSNPLESNSSTPNLRTEENIEIAQLPTQSNEIVTDPENPSDTTSRAPQTSVGIYENAERHNGKVRVRIQEPERTAPSRTSALSPRSQSRASGNSSAASNVRRKGRQGAKSPKPNGPRPTISSPITNPIRKDGADTGDPWARGVCSLCLEKYVIPECPQGAAPTSNGGSDPVMSTREGHELEPEQHPNKPDANRDREAVCLPGCGHAFCRACLTTYLDRRTAPKRKKAPRDSSGALEAVVVEEGDMTAEEEALAAAAAQSGLSKVERWLGVESGPGGGRIPTPAPASVRSGRSAGAPSVRYGERATPEPNSAASVRGGVAAAALSVFSGRTGRSNVRSMIAAASAKTGGTARGGTPISGLQLPGASRASTPVPGGGVVQIGEDAMLSLTIYCPLCRKSSTVTRISMKYSSCGHIVHYSHLLVIFRIVKCTSEYGTFTVLIAIWTSAIVQVLHFTLLYFTRSPNFQQVFSLRLES